MLSSLHDKDTLRISCIGYLDKQYLIRDLKNEFRAGEEIRIELSSISYNLDEVLRQSGGTFSGDFWTGYDWYDYSFTNSKCKYIIIDQSTMKIIRSFTSWYDTTNAHFYPELTSLTDRIDSIVWNNLLYIRQ